MAKNTFVQSPRGNLRPEELGAEAEGLAAAEPGDLSGAPQEEQNFAPSLPDAPHCAQKTMLAQDTKREAISSQGRCVGGRFSSASSPNRGTPRNLEIFGINTAKGGFVPAIGLHQRTFDHARTPPASLRLSRARRVALAAPPDSDLDSESAATQPEAPSLGLGLGTRTRSLRVRLRLTVSDSDGRGLGRDREPDSVSLRTAEPQAEAQTDSGSELARRLGGSARGTAP
eukprot:3103411-Rhodomonas_salina.1